MLEAMGLCLFHLSGVEYSAAMSERVNASNSSDTCIMLNIMHFISSLAQHKNIIIQILSFCLLFRNNLISNSILYF